MNHLAGVLAILLLISLSGTEGAPSCSEMVNQLSPCIPYLMENQAKPSAACCNGVKYISKYSKKKRDREAICQCLESSAQIYPLIDLSLVSSLPKNCGLSVKLPLISRDFDCSKYVILSPSLSYTEVYWQAHVYIHV